MSDKSAEKTAVLPFPSAAPEAAKEKTYTIVTKDKTLTAKAGSIAWTENGQFILLMDGETTKHLIVAANVLAVTED